LEAKLDLVSNHTQACNRLALHVPQANGIKAAATAAITVQQVITALAQETPALLHAQQAITVEQVCQVA